MNFKQRPFKYALLVISAVVLGILYRCGYPYMLARFAPHPEMHDRAITTAGKYLSLALLSYSVDHLEMDLGFMQPGSVADVTQSRQQKTQFEKFSLTDLKWRSFWDTNKLLVAFSGPLPEAKPAPFWPRSWPLYGWPEDTVPKRHLLLYVDGTMAFVDAGEFPAKLAQEQEKIRALGYDNIP